MRWLISFQYTACFYHKDRPTSTVGPQDGFELSDKHPAKFRLSMERAFDKARNGTGDRCGDMLHRIYSAIEVPDGTLTEDEIDDM